MKNYALLLFIPIAVLLFSCGGDDSKNVVPEPKAVPGVNVKTLLTTKLNYQNLPVDEVDYLVYDVTTFFTFSIFDQIPAGQHTYQYTFWQKGQPYTYSPLEEATEEVPEEEAVEEAPEEAAAEEAAASLLPDNLLASSEGTEEGEAMRTYKSGSYYFNTEGSPSYTVYNKFNTADVLEYGAGTYYFDVYLDGNLIERKEIKVLSEEEKNSGTYEPYWLSKDLYSQLAVREEGDPEAGDEWQISYFKYMKNPIVQVMVVPYEAFNRFFVVVKEGNRSYVMYELKKSSNEKLLEINGADDYEVRFFTHMDDKKLYFYNAYKTYNSVLDLSSNEISFTQEIPVSIPERGEYPSVGGGRSAGRSCTGNISFGGENIHEYTSGGDCGWISWNNTSSKFYFNANGVYAYDVTTKRKEQVLYKKDIQSLAYFSNNGMDFIAYVDGNQIMLATNQKADVTGAYFMSEYGANKVEIIGLPVFLEDTLEVDYYNKAKSVFSKTATMEMEGFTSSVLEVGDITNIGWTDAKLVRIELADEYDTKGSMPVYTDHYFAYAVASKDSFAFLSNHIPTQGKYGNHIEVGNARQIKINDPGYAFTKTKYFDQYKFVGMDGTSIVPELLIPEKLETATTKMKLEAAIPYTMPEAKKLTPYGEATSKKGSFMLMLSEKDNGSFHIVRPDQSQIVYTYDFGTQNTMSNAMIQIKQYGPFTDRTCDGARKDLAAIMEVDSNQLQKAGTYDGHAIYTLKDKDHAILKKEYERYTGSAGEMGGNDDTKSFNEFKNSNPVFFWKDNGNRYVRFVKKEFMTPLMCEPILYLYPEKEQQTQVALGDQIDVFASIPRSETNIWQLHAYSDGTFRDLKTNATNHRLFWEGKSLNIPPLEQGYVLPREEISAFLSEKLSYLGLNEMETREFKEAWMEELTEKDYCFIGFYDRETIDMVAPMQISPNPDVLIRILMDYRPLDNYEEVSAPKLIKAPARKGFAAIEWGGLKR